MPDCQIHHLSFTLPVAMTAADLPQLAKELFHIEGLDPAAVKLPRGRNGYRESYTLTGEHGAELISIQLSGVAGNLAGTSHLDVHGDALEAGGFDVLHLCREIVARRGWVTRVDLAADDTGGVLPWAEIVECSRSDQYENRITTTTCRPRKNRKTGTMEPNPPTYMRETGESLYFGELDSDLSICAYTRRGPVRVEARIRNRAAATDVVRRIAEGEAIHDLTLGVLRRNLTFHVAGWKRKDRRPAAPWWSSFLDSAPAVKLLRQRPDSNRSPWFVPPTRTDRALKAIKRHLAGAPPEEIQGIAEMLYSLTGASPVPAF
ncbi:hypothetical protein GMSM_45950 [Geomonas sp. Red276]